KVWHYDFQRKWTLEEVIKFLYSTSFSSRRFFGRKIKAFEQELTQKLLHIEPSGIFQEEVRLEALVAKK
ncbi:MAG: class I SAM-dependent methyltransferase, partial [Patescibacteria group bacterium]